MARDSGREWPSVRPRQRPRTLWSDLAGLWGRFVGLPVAARIAAGLLVTLLVIVLLSRLFGPDDDGTNVAARSTTIPSTSAFPSTTTTVPLPPGDDKTVKDVLDGDSFETIDGIKIRLIGIDAPDVETRGCFSAEATGHLRELLPAQSTVRIAYDTNRSDRSGRTLAYAYRTTDGLFVNVAMARDGFARQLTSPPNTAHAEEINAAVSEAVAERRGMWQGCQTTTTIRRSTTVPPSAATPTSPNSPAPSAPPSAPPSNPGPVPGAVERDGLCLLPGAPGYFSDGTPAVCGPGSDGLPRWLPA